MQVKYGFETLELKNQFDDGACNVRGVFMDVLEGCLSDNDDAVALVDGAYLVNRSEFF